MPLNISCTNTSHTDNILNGGVGRNTNAFGCHLLSVVLEVESHHSVEL